MTFFAEPLLTAATRLEHFSQTVLGPKLHNLEEEKPIP